MDKTHVPFASSVKYFDSASVRYLVLVAEENIEYVSINAIFVFPVSNID